MAFVIVITKEGLAVHCIKRRLGCPSQSKPSQNCSKKTHLKLRTGPFNIGESVHGVEQIPKVDSLSPRLLV